MDELNCIVHGDWFIQSRETRHSIPELHSYIAWASHEQIDDPLGDSKSDVYFDFGRDEAEAVSRIIAEVDALSEGS